MEPIKLDDEIFSKYRAGEYRLTYTENPIEFFCDDCATPLTLQPVPILLLNETDDFAHIFPLQLIYCPECHKRIAVINIHRKPMEVTQEFQSISKGD